MPGGQADAKTAGARPKRTALTVSVLGGAALAALVLALYRLSAPPLVFFSAPLFFAGCVISVCMAARWRQWQALPLSLVFALLLVHQAIELLLARGAIATGESARLLSEIVLYAGAPLGFAAIAGLWRIFENQAKVEAAQQSVQESERRYRHLIQNATDAVYTADAAGRFTLVNTGASRLFGRRAGDLIGMSVYELMPADSRSDIEAALARQQSEQVSAFYHEFPLERRDGTVRWVGQNVQAVLERGALKGFQAVLRDITERRQVEEALRQSETRLRTLFETISEGLIRLDGDGRIAFANPAADRILDAPPGSLEKKHCAEAGWALLKPDSSQLHLEEWIGYRALREKRSFENVVTGLIARDGQVRWLNMSAVPIVADRGRVDGAVVSFTDISKTKQAEENLRIIEFALDNAVEHVFLLGREGQVIYANQSALRALGYTSAEIATRTIHDIDRDTSPADWDETWRRAKAGEWPTFESIHVAKDGRTFPTATSANYVQFGGREYIFAFVHDITRETELAAQLRQSQKMEAIGTLAGGIAHDFNNILSGVLGYTELAMHEVPADSMALRMLKEVHRGGLRAADLVDQILTFSRRSTQEKHPLRMGPVLKEALKLLRGSLPSTIEIRQHIEVNTSPVMADPGQIHQVIVNLCTNAYQAIGDKPGTIEVGLDEVTITPAGVSTALKLRPGSYAHLSVTDNGRGMNEETRRRMFEPFFTTKQPGEGTGLGLATVHGIVKSHRGTIHVESEPGKGTRFDLYFPVSVEPARPEPAERPVDTGVPEGGHERILFVDDEEAVLGSGSMALELLGYSVTKCSSSVEARDLVRTQPDEYDLVITDQTMPRMTGFELARAILNARPSLPIILCTGFNETVSRQGVKEAGISELLKKPVSLKTLAQTVRDLLDERSGKPPRPRPPPAPAAPAPVATSDDEDDDVNPPPVRRAGPR